MIRHGRHVVSQYPKQKHFPPSISKHFLIFPGGECLCLEHWLRSKNMAPMTNADESPYAFLTEHFSLYSIYSLSGRQQRVLLKFNSAVSETAVSETLPVSSVVPQGSILGPLLFLSLYKRPSPYINFFAFCRRFLVC